MSASLTFVTPPPGLDPVVDFVLDEVEGAHGLYSLHAASTPPRRLFVVDAAVHLPDYSPEITDEQSAALGVTRAEDALVLVVANPSAVGTTVNLMAPIVVNSSTGAAAQLILEGQDWSLRAELAPRGAAGSGVPAVPAASAVPTASAVPAVPTASAVPAAPAASA